MAWEIFERAAMRYENWYETPIGVQVSRAEEALLAWLLRPFGAATTLLEIGCGTGHFTRWLASQGHGAFGLDRSPAMLAELRSRSPALPVVLGDAHRLPFRDRAVDLAIFVATLEFLESPELALAEASRVARRGLVLLLLNRWSRGAVSRRWGADSEGGVLRHARDVSLCAATCIGSRGMAPARVSRRFAGEARCSRHRSTTLAAPLPFGDVLGVTVALSV